MLRHLHLVAFDIRLALLGAPLAMGSFGCSAGSSNPTEGATDNSGGSDMTGSAGSAIVTSTGSSGSTSAGSGGSVSGSGGAGVGPGGKGGAGGAGGSGSMAMPGSEKGIVAAGVRWVGRVDDKTSATTPFFGWTASGFVATFTGTSVGVKLNTDAISADQCLAAPCGLFFVSIVDGQPPNRFKITPGMSTKQLATGLSAGAHTLQFYRDSESPFGKSQFLGLSEGTLGIPPTYSGRVIEFIGDSITTGWGELGSEQHVNYGTQNACGFTLDTEAGYQSYGPIIGRNLNADWSVVSLSGWGLYRGRGTGPATMTMAMPLEYSDSYYTFGTSPQWDFRVKASAVVINLGTNDTNAGDPGVGFTTALATFVDTLRMKNPGVWIFPLLGPVLSGVGRDQIKKYMQDVVMMKGGDAAKIAFIDLGTQDALKGTGCGWHPNVTGHQAIADALTPIIKAKLGW